MTTILITGSSGQLGSELREISGQYSGYEFVFTDADELDISDEKSVYENIKRISPSWIINCAAYTAVDKAEDEEKEAFIINAQGVENIANAIRDTSCRLIQVSTDYVFDGTSAIPYNESDSTCPVSAYGRSKLGGEKAALSIPMAMIIRTSWLYSSSGNNFVRTILGKAGTSEELNVVFDQAGSPTYAADLASAIMTIISGTIQNRHVFVPGIFHYANEGVCSWYDMAVEIINATESACRINAIRSSAYPAKARRPSYSVLDKTKIKDAYSLIVPHWRTSLLKCLKKITQV